MQEPRDGKAQDGEEKEVIENGVAVRMVENPTGSISSQCPRSPIAEAPTSNFGQCECNCGSCRYAVCAPHL